MTSGSVATENARPNTPSTTMKEWNIYKRPVEWGLPDFVGKYHLNRMSTDNPVPGTAIRVEQERKTFVEKRASVLKEVVSEIEARRALRVTSRIRKAAITSRVEVQATVGYKIDSGQRSGRRTHLVRAKELGREQM